MTESIKNLIQKPESDTLEFKSSIVQTPRTARLLSAFANTKGGHLIVGVDDNGLPVGVEQPERILAHIKVAASIVYPDIEYRISQEVIDNKTLIAVYVPKGINALYTVDEKYYRRVGAQTAEVPPSLQTLNIYSTAIQSISSGSVAQGEGAVAVGSQGILIGGDIKGRIITGDNNKVVSQSVKNAEIVSFDKAFERLSGSTTFVVEQLRISYEQTREQAKGWYRFSLIAAVLGFILIVSGAIVAIAGQTTAGIITALSRHLD